MTRGCLGIQFAGRHTRRDQRAHAASSAAAVIRPGSTIARSWAGDL